MNNLIQTFTNAKSVAIALLYLVLILPIWAFCIVKLIDVAQNVWKKGNLWKKIGIVYVFLFLIYFNFLIFGIFLD